jgi:hypothetical protein
MSQKINNLWIPFLTFGIVHTPPTQGNAHLETLHKAKHYENVTTDNT